MPLTYILCTLTLAFKVGVGGRKSRIILSMSAAAEFKTNLTEFSDYHSNMGPTHGTTEANNHDENDGLLKSATIVKDRKRYYLDLKENQRGRFLRVLYYHHQKSDFNCFLYLYFTFIQKVSMVTVGGPRAQIAIPAQGLIEFKDHLAELLEKFGTTDEPDNVQMPESKFMRADNKTFYFDCGSNARGIFLRLSEVRQYSYRSSITVPEKYWDQFAKNITDFIENVKAEKEKKPAKSETPNKNDNNAAASAAPTPAPAVAVAEK